MRKTVAALWNLTIEICGSSVARLLAPGIRRGWVYFPFVSEALSVLPFSAGWKFRKAVYSRLLPKYGSKTVLHFGATIEDYRTTFGEDVWVSVGTYIDYAEIGDFVMIGPHAVLLSGGRHHNFDRIDIPIKHQGNPPKAPLKICRGAWIGANATIMAPVGEHAVVGAGAVVTKEVPPYAVVAGNPARVLYIRGEKTTAAVEHRAQAVPGLH